MVTILVFIITLLILVVIHEFGHFFAAKRFGIKVLEFGFGIPPRIVGRKYGETLVSLNWLPIGGFVRLLGEDEVDKKILENEHNFSEWKKRSFVAQSVGKRITVVIAGVLMNLLLAWILFWILLYMINFRVTLPLPSKQIPLTLGVYQSIDNLILIGSVGKDSPAEKVGIKGGDRIIALNDKFVSSSEEVITKTKEFSGKKLKITLSDIEKTKYRSVELVPRENPPQGQGAVGIGLESSTALILEYRNLWQKIFSGPIHSLNMTIYMVTILANSISSSVVERNIAPVASNLGGPIAIAYVTHAILSFGQFTDLLNLVAALSLTLAFMNVLPIPALDGGRLLFLYIEGLSGKKVPSHIESKIHAIGMAVLLSLIVLISYKDLRTFFF